MTVATYPAYNPDAYSTWKIGGLGGGQDAGQYIGLAGTVGGTWFLCSAPLTIDPINVLLTEVKFGLSLGADVECDAVRFGILQGNTSAVTLATLANGLDYVDMSANRANLNWQLITTSLPDIPFTFQEGISYWVCFGLRGKAGRQVGAPGFRRLNAGVGPQAGYWRSGSQTQADWGTTGLFYQTAQLDHLRYQLTFKTKARKLLSTNYSSAKTFYIPRRTDGDYWVKMGDAVVADGQALTAVLETEASAAASARTTLALDMGVTDQVTFGGANVALAAAGAEAGDTFEMGINVRPATGKMDLFYQNRTTGQGAEGALDFMTRSHACKNGAARAASYTVADANWIKAIGTASVGTIEVGYDPLVLFGDSQVNAFVTAIPTAFTQPRMTFRADISGNRLTGTAAGFHTAGYLRYKHTTPGNGDLCEMTGIVFVFLGYGLNDVSASIGTTEANRNKLMGLFGTRVAEILDDLQDRANETIIVGLPPYSDGEASEQEAHAIKSQLNPMLEGLAVGCRCTYLNPWWDMVSPGTENDAIPVFNGQYSNNAYSHYDTDGVAVVAPLIARAYESGLVGGPWRKRNTHGRYPGVLLPL